MSTDWLVTAPNGSCGRSTRSRRAECCVVCAAVPTDGHVGHEHEPVRSARAAPATSTMRADRSARRASSRSASKVLLSSSPIVCRPSVQPAGYLAMAVSSAATSSA